jgi:cobalt-zinc-cadmium resistance protein CzcA
MTAGGLRAAALAARRRRVPLSELARIERTDGPVQGRSRERLALAVVQSNVAGATWSASSKRRAHAVKAERCRCRPATAWSGAASSRTSSAPRRLAWWCRWRSALIFLLLFDLRLGAPGAAGAGQHSVRAGGRRVRAVAGGEYLSVPASVGFIALLGIAVLNGLVLVSYFNQLRAAACRSRTWCAKARVRRLRPVLMTASITAFGLVPLLFASGPGSEIQRPLAVVVIGGLFTSTLLTLLVLPVLFRRFAQFEVRH